MHSTCSRLATLVVPILIALLALVLAVQPAGAVPREERIVFQGFEGGGSHVFSMTPEGKNVVQITNGPDYDDWPRISPDGTKIVFQRGDYPHKEVWVMDADGTNQVNLTNNAADDQQPAWSPDGKKIAFRSERSGTANIWVMNAADGSGRVDVTTSEFWIDYSPAWSPDGNTIVFSRQAQSGRFHIFSVGSGGGVLADLTPTVPDNVYGAAWSPDGSRIAVSVRPSHSSDTDVESVYEIAIPSGVMTRRSTMQGDSPRYSLDGTRIVFHSDRVLDEDDLYILDPDGTETKVFGPAFDSDWGLLAGSAGDVDGNGSLDTHDVTVLMAFIAGTGPQPIGYALGKVDCDGDVDVMDVLWMLKRIAGLGKPQC